jgi:uncharacterized protein YoxC
VDRLNVHITETEKVDGVSRELNARTRILATDLTSHITQTEGDIASMKQDIVNIRKQVANCVIDEVKAVSNSVAECNSKILVEREVCQLEIQNVTLEIDNLR